MKIASNQSELAKYFRTSVGQIRKWKSEGCSELQSPPYHIVGIEAWLDLRARKNAEKDFAKDENEVADTAEQGDGKKPNKDRLGVAALAIAGLSIARDFFGWSGKRLKSKASDRDNEKANYGMQSEFVEAVRDALGGGTSKKDAATTLVAVLDCIADGIRKDRVVQIIGFGTFKVKEREARKSRNPKTGETIQIKSSKTVGFSASSTFKDSL